MLTEEFFRSHLLTILREAEARNTWDNAPANPVKMSAEALRRAALKISHAAGAVTGSRCTRYPKCSIRRASRSTV